MKIHTAKRIIHALTAGLLLSLAAGLHLNYVLVQRVEAMAAEREAARPLPGPTLDQAEAICAHYRATGQSYRCREV